MATAEPLRVSYAEYLAAEERAETRHEYVRGEIFAMAGGTIEHARLAMSFGIALGNALAGLRCAVFSADARTRIADIDVATYPDLTVVCGPVVSAADDRNGITNPVVLVEVLSDSTEAYDRGEKFRRYRHVSSLREYVLVSQGEPHVEVFRRGDDGLWTLEEFGPGERVRLPSVDASIEVDAVYRNPLEESPPVS